MTYAVVNSSSRAELAQALNLMLALRKAGLPKSCLVAYVAIACRINPATDTASLSYREIAEDTGMIIPDTAVKAVKALVAAGFISKERLTKKGSHGTNSYKLTTLVSA